MSPLDRLMAKVDKRPDGCWIWTAYINKGTGYGSFWWDGRTTAHRAAYRLLVGEIPEGLELDHLCRVRACCNPSHLEPVTRQVNQLRGETVAARHAAQAACVRGHEFARRDGRGKRVCVTCRRDAQIARRAKASAGI